jgi:hypothetical protein
MSVCRLPGGSRFQPGLLCKNPIHHPFCFAIFDEQADSSGGGSREAGEMFAVPVAIVVLWVASVSAQVGVVWPNYEAEKAKSEQAEKGASEEKPEKAKSEQAEKRSAKNKPRKAGESSSDAVSTGKRKKQDP